MRAAFTSESFPSGHVMSATVLYGFIVWMCARRGLPRVLAAPATILSAAVLALTGIVHVWLGVHWPGDILGGYVWGVAVLAAVVAGMEVLAAARSTPDVGTEL